MIICKKYNNNVVQTCDDNLQELIVIGNGIAYGKKPGDWIEEGRVERTFVLLDSSQKQAFFQLLDEIAIEQFELSERVIAFAKSHVNTVLNEHLHLTLADHISFAISRHEKGIPIYNPLLMDIRHMYQKEFEVGLFALECIKREFGITLPEDEAGFIATHIIDAEFNHQDLAVSAIMQISNHVIKILRYRYKIKLDENTLSYSRFLTHIKFFAQRILKKEQVLFGGGELFRRTMESYPEAYEIAENICQYVRENFSYEVNEDERFFLVVHIERLRGGEAIGDP